MSSLEPKMAPRALVSFDQLSNTAQTLNVASDRLSKAMEDLDEALSMLNLGITSWVEFSSHEEGPFSEAEAIGYAKINGTWGIGLRKTFDDQNDRRAAANSLSGVLRTLPARCAYEGLAISTNL